jgi:transposase
MRRVRELLRLKFEAGLALRDIVRRTGVPRRTVRALFDRFEGRGLTWPLGEDVTEDDLEGLLFREAGAKAGRRRPEPDWSEVHRELKAKHVTLQILWDEYIDLHPDGYRYSRFCEIYRDWEAKLSVTMRQAYKGGEKLFVDYAGDLVPVVIDRHTGETRFAHIFVAVTVASRRLHRWSTCSDGMGDKAPPRRENGSARRRQRQCPHHRT